MKEEEIKQVVVDYITDGVEADNADSLHERDEWYQHIGQDSETDLKKAYAFYRKAKVTVTFNA